MTGSFEWEEYLELVILHVHDISTIVILFVQMIRIIQNYKIFVSDY